MKVESISANLQRSSHHLQEVMSQLLLVTDGIWLYCLTAFLVNLQPRNGVKQTGQPQKPKMSVANLKMSEKMSVKVRLYLGYAMSISLFIISFRLNKSMGIF